jgi:dipeptidyl aminopeptidase/acylaminoacyl peptidase
MVQFAGVSGEARFSPDGKWLAYTAVDPSVWANPDIYVCPVAPQPRTGRRITAGGGSQPHWSRNGQELFYLNPDHHIVVMGFTATGENFRVGSAKTLFTTSEDTGFDIANDGKRFLIGAPLGEQQGKIFLTVNFDSTLAAMLKDR